MREFLDRFWQHSKLVLDKNKSLSFDEKLLAVVLATNEENFDRFIALKEFRQILQKLGLKADTFSVQSAQISSLNYLKQGKISATKIIKSLEILEKELILKSEDFLYLKELIMQISDQNEKTSTQDTKNTDFFHDKKERLDSLYMQLLNSASHCQERLKEQKQKIDELKFTVVVTGVINAGKSSLLNALLGKKILGTSNVPETVNLTILTHSYKPFAKVSFWSESELNELGIIPKISHKQAEICIDTNELKNYTSAKNNLSELVKCVTLYEDLDLVRDNIHIVDTPGIDDAVFLREQLVREYMSECDMMVHLMNASQSASKKDIEFLLHSIKNSHIARLCIVLTHSDMLAEKELNEVANYTIKSIYKALNDANLDEISKSLNIFVVSSKRFEEGKNNSGVQEFKAFLYETFFGENNQKASLAIKAYQNELIQICTFELAKIEEKLLILLSSSNEVKEKILHSSKLLNQLENRSKNIDELAKTELAKLDINALDTSFKTALIQLGTNAKDKLLNEVAYAKKISKMDTKRANYILQTTLNDGILSLARQKRNEILALINSCTQTLMLNFTELNLQNQSVIFNIGEYMTAQNIKLDYAKLFEKIAKNLNTKELENTLSVALSEFLENEKLSHFVSNLANLEKEKFRANLTTKLAEELTRQRQKLHELNEYSSLLARQNNEILQLSDELNAKKVKFSDILKELKDA
ncbi:dynamin family protein [Campylobacter sp. M4]|uniref:dynamin family protein n=1 Tax=Campylobacter sp. M4 TaxID=3424761 RepID=UPI003D34DED9